MAEKEAKHIDEAGYDSSPELAYLYDFIPMYESRDDFHFFVNEAIKSSGNCLELGCGTGRILLPIARAGVDIVGLDTSHYMLERASEKVASEHLDVQKHIRLQRGNMVNFTLGEKFSLVTIPFRAFMHLVSIEDQMSCLRCVKEHLRPDGRLIMDFYQVNPAIIEHLLGREEIEDTPLTELPDGSSLRRTVRIVEAHPSKQVNEIEMRYYISDSESRVRCQVHRFPMRYFYPFELEHLLARCGFQVDRMLGNFNGDPLADDSSEIIVIASCS
ncbi:class I SAM-dependent methyltransferase [bacterium]|nr:class I SAM-dependent methyltransferase [bacterium]